MNLSVSDLSGIESQSTDGWKKLSGDKTFRDVSTDSRTIKPGDLFVALHGDSFDGHKFLKQVFEKGAVGAVVDHKWFKLNATKTGIQKQPLLIVQNTLDALGEAAKRYRMKFNLPVLVVAGSNGKTTTKDLIGHVLGTEKSVLKTEANYNNQVGLPKMLFQLRDGHDCAVLEIGTNHPGEIEWLVNVAQPTEALITNIGREHLEFFHDLKGVAKEERAAFDFVAEHGGTGFVNLDDKYLSSATKQLGERAFTYGVAAEARVSASRLGYTKDGRLELRLTIDGKGFSVRTHLLADYAANVAAAAATVATHFGMRRTEIKAALETFKPHSKRLEMMKLPMGITVINDAYNANPDSMASAARTLAEIPAQGKKYLVLGDMFELGAKSLGEHRSLGKIIADFPFEKVFFTGKEMLEAYKSFSRKNDAGKHFPSKEALADQLREELATGDTVLIKGSRGMRMEEIIDLLQRG